MGRIMNFIGKKDAPCVVLRFRLLLGSLLMVSFFLASPGIAAETGIAAKVNGVAITTAELERAIDSSVPSNSFHGSAGKREEYRKPALDRLIAKELLFQKAEASGLTVDEGEVDRVVQEVAGRYKERAAFEKALKAAGMDLKSYRELARKNATVKKFLKAEAEDKASCSEKELEDYYSANKGRFLTPESFRVRHILLKVAPLATGKEKAAIREKAENLLKLLKGGEDFSKIAAKYSEDRYRTKGGDLGWLQGGGLEAPALDEAIAHLKAGETSGVIETIYGFHILRLEEKRPAAQRSFAEVKDALKKELESKKYNELVNALIKPLREKAKIEIFQG